MMAQCTSGSAAATSWSAKLPQRCLITHFRNLRRSSRDTRGASCLRSVAYRQTNGTTIDEARVEDFVDNRKAMLQKILASGLPERAGCARFGFPKGSLQKSTEELFARAGTVIIT